MSDLHSVGIDGCYCLPIDSTIRCPHCGAANNGELHMPEMTLLCYVCEERFEVGQGPGEPPPPPPDIGPCA